VFSDQDSNAAPQIVQTASSVCGTKNFSPIRLYSALQIAMNCRHPWNMRQGRLHNPPVTSTGTSRALQ
jgi:hypothetical protein